MYNILRKQNGERKMEKFSAEFMNALSKLPEFEEINDIIS